MPQVEIGLLVENCLQEAEEIGYEDDDLEAFRRACYGCEGQLMLKKGQEEVSDIASTFGLAMWHNVAHRLPGPLKQCVNAINIATGRARRL